MRARSYSSSSSSSSSKRGLDPGAYVSLLRQCKGLASAKIVHSRLQEDGFGQNSLLRNYLIQTYGKLGSVQDARDVFNSLEARNVKNWNFLLGAYTQNREHRQEGLRLLAQMIGQEGLEPDEYTFINSVSALAEFGHLDEARGLFDRVHNENVVAWTAMMAAYAQHGHCQVALELYRDMTRAGVQPNNVTFVTVLGICSSLRHFEEGRAVHERILASPGAGSALEEVPVHNALVNMYAKCGRLELARQVFDGISCRNVVSWTGMIAAYTHRGHAAMALELYFKMLLDGVEPNAVTFVSVLSACSDLGDHRTNTVVIMCTAALGLGWCSPVQNALISLHAKAGDLEAAGRVFSAMDRRDVVSWNSMLGAYVQHGHHRRAFQLYHQMDLEGVRLTSFTFATILGACTVDNLREGQMIHRRVLSTPLQADDVLDNALLNMYAKCGELETAEHLFEKQRVKDLVSWNVMISACVQQGLHSKALDYYRRMDIDPSVLIYATALGACSTKGDTSEAKLIHARIVSSGLQSEALVQNAILNLHGKSGQIEIARTFFFNMKHRSFVSWNIIIAVHAQHNFPAEALQLYREMELEGMKPDGLTLMAVLLACTYAGLLEEGRKLFTSLCGDHGVRPVLEHYHLLIDLLARSGRLEEAQELMGSMPHESDGVGLRSLVGSFRIHGEANRGVKAAEDALALYPTVCWLEQKPDEVESYLISAASPELVPFEPLESATNLPTLPTDAKPVALPPAGAVTRGSAEEEAFLESAVLDAEANSQEAADDESTIIDMDAGQDNKEEAVLHELQGAVAKLGENTRLLICKALYRLAGSAVLRRRVHETMDKFRRGETSAIEASTNSLDRTIASLLFHRHGKPTVKPLSTHTPPAANEATTSSAQGNENIQPTTMVTKLPAVMTNKQLDFPLVSSTKLRTASRVPAYCSNGKALADFSIQAKKVSAKMRLIENSRKRIKLQ